MGVYKLVCYDFKMNIFYKGELNKLSRPTSFVHYLFFETKQMSCGNSWPRGVVVKRQTIIILLRSTVDGHSNKHSPTSLFVKVMYTYLCLRVSISVQ